MYLHDDVKEQLAPMGIEVSMFADDAAREEWVERYKKNHYKDYKYEGGYSESYDPKTQQWVTDGKVRDGWEAYMDEKIAAMLAETDRSWGPMYDATEVYIKQGDFICKRTVQKGKSIEVDWVLGVLEREQKAYQGAYGQFARDVQKMFKEKFAGQPICGFVYPTTYGIGVWVFYNRKADVCVEQVRSILDANGIEYYNEFSDARLVYRFKISKKEVNRKKLVA